MKYARGTYASGECDRCGWRYPYLDLRLEWTGYKVCPTCYETKHPQLRIRKHDADPEALQDPRPSKDDMGTTIPLDINLIRKGPRQ